MPSDISHPQTDKAALSTEQCELIDLLRNELAEFIDAGLHPIDDDTDFQLFDAKTQCETIGQAADLVGLHGLNSSCEILADNYQVLSECSSDVSAHMENLNPWAIYLLAYLQSLLDTGNTDQCVVDLLDFLQSDKLLKPIDSKGRLHLLERFNSSEIIADSDSETQVDTIDADLLSLEYDSDARAELIDGLLIELPQQEQSFAMAISRYLEHRKITDLQEAQRVAHTIKGAANVVGVKAVASLVHYLEDILQFFDKAQRRGEEQDSQYKINNSAFDSLLQESSDCLASMVEALLGQGRAPENIHSVLQSLLNWHNALHRDGWPTDEESLALNIIETAPLLVTGEATVIKDEVAVATNNEAPSQSPTEDTPTAAEASLRVSESLIDELLRLAGENIIANTRVISSSDEMQQSLDHISQNHLSLRQIIDNFEQLVDVKGAAANKRKRHLLSEGPASASEFVEPSRSKDEQELDELELEEYSELHTVAHQLLELSSDTREFVEQLDEQLNELKDVAITQADINRDNHHTLLRTRMLPASTLSARLNRCVRQTCRLTHKAAQLVIKGDELLIDNHVLNQLADPIMHLLRNAIDHGIEESAQERIDLGKSAEGIITLEFIREGESIVVQCSDDGVGFTAKEIESTAIERELIPSNHELTEEQLQQLIFLPGFSTRKEVSQTSGRGVGLDVVRASVRQFKGSISIDSQQYNGSQFRLKLPMTLLSNHAMLIQAQQGLVSIISRGVEQLLFIEHAELIASNSESGSHYEFLYNDEYLPVHNLNSLLSVGTAQAHPKADFYNILIAQRADGARCAVLISAVLESRNIVVKPLNDYSYHAPGIIGATILGSGTVSPVLDLPELLDNYYLNAHGTTPQLSALLQMEPTQLDSRPMALVVDDSLSVRRALSLLIEDIGMEVRTAKDGFEAIDVINDKTPSLVLVDLEMPKMNGLELTEHLRAREATRDLPVIMITSRTTEKHRALARTAGVSSYVMKPFSEDELLEIIREEMTA
jgi:chemosensory pili system protein ChpA (sensor histidine kinase/response regulator)